MRPVYFCNLKDEVVRVFNVNVDKSFVILRRDLQRVEIVENLSDLELQKIPFLSLGELALSEKGPRRQDVLSLGFLSLDRPTQTVSNVSVLPESQRDWWSSLSIVSVLVFGFMTFILSLSSERPSLEEELKQHVVKIIKRTPKVDQKSYVGQTISRKETKAQPVQRTVKRMGALAVLGRLNKSRQQRGGLNLGAVRTSPGPGLGGTQGSGGVQTSLYGKGLIAAPVGPGSNVKGGGGYGTKGKGGGQDGYGQMSLIGSTGTASIPLGKEAIIQGGLDRDMIAAVIQKNMGQIRFCYEQGLQTDPKLTGRVGVRFVIGNNGQVKVAQLDSSTVHSRLVEDCILMRLRTWKFPSPEGGVDVKVSYPFLLRRLGSG